MEFVLWALSQWMGVPTIRKWRSKTITLEVWLWGNAPIVTAWQWPETLAGKRPWLCKYLLELKLNAGSSVVGEKDNAQRICKAWPWFQASCQQVKTFLLQKVTWPSWLNYMVSDRMSVVIYWRRVKSHQQDWLGWIWLNTDCKNIYQAEKYSPPDESAWYVTDKDRLLDWAVSVALGTLAPVCLKPTFFILQRL